MNITISASSVLSPRYSHTHPKPAYSQSREDSFGNRMFYMVRLSNELFSFIHSLYNSIKARIFLLNALLVIKIDCSKFNNVSRRRKGMHVYPNTNVVLLPLFQFQKGGGTRNVIAGWYRNPRAIATLMAIYGTGPIHCSVTGS